MAPNKAFSVFLIALMVSGAVCSYLGMVKAESTIPKPSVPEFTLKLVDHSYDMPTTTTATTDPYTGEKTVTTHRGYHVENKSLEIQIKNQAFTPYYLDNQLIGLYYNISYKGHYEETWKYNSCYDYGWFFSQSSSDYTIITFEPHLPTKGQIDFRVQAQIGYFSEGTAVWPIGRVYEFSGQVSGWSNTQTLTISDNGSKVTPSPSPLPSSPTPTAASSQNPTVTPIQPISGNPMLFGLDWVGIGILALLAVIAVLLVFVVVYLHKRSVK